jgi:phospholipid N-methyltransferase
LFFKKFIRQPKINASIMPSSPMLAQAMIDGIDFSRIKTIIEFGPGT